MMSGDSRTAQVSGSGTSVEPGGAVSAPSGRDADDAGSLGSEGSERSRGAPYAWVAVGEQERLAYRVLAGAGLTIVDPLRYGVTLDAIAAAPGQQQFLSAMAAGFCLMMYDQRGSGGSARAGASSSWEERADDLWRVADDAGVERAVLYGVADAGHTVAHAALRQPERALGLIFNFVPLSFAASSAREGVARERVEPWFGAAGASRWSALSMMEDFGIAASDATESINAWGATAQPGVLAQTQRLIASSELRSVLPRLAQPALVIEPQRRAMFLGWGESLAALLPNGRVARPARGIEMLGTIHAFLALLTADYGRRASQLSPALSRAVTRGEQSMRETRRIAVAVDDDVAAARAVELACRLGETQRAEIALIHVVHVPYALPLDQPPRDEVRRGERALSLGDAIVQRHGLPPPQRRLVRGRSVAGSILMTAEALGSDLIVIADRGATHRSGAGRSEVVDELLRRAPGKVVVDRARQ